MALLWLLSLMFSSCFHCNWQWDLPNWNKGKSITQTQWLKLIVIWNGSNLESFIQRHKQHLVQMAAKWFLTSNNLLFFMTGKVFPYSCVWTHSSFLAFFFSTEVKCLFHLTGNLFLFQKTSSWKLFECKEGIFFVVDFFAFFHIQLHTFIICGEFLLYPLWEDIHVIFVFTFTLPTKKKNLIYKKPDNVLQVFFYTFKLSGEILNFNS